MLGAGGVVKLVDFGVAKLEGSTVTGGGATPGTAAYMSPEQVRGEDVDHRTDLWALGVVLYEMLAGKRPFSGGSDATIAHAIITREPVRLRALGSEHSGNTGRHRRACAREGSGAPLSIGRRDVGGVAAGRTSSRHRGASTSGTHASHGRRARWRGSRALRRRRLLAGVVAWQRFTTQRARACDPADRAAGRARELRRGVRARRPSGTRSPGRLGTRATHAARRGSPDGRITARRAPASGCVECGTMDHSRPIARSPA